MSNNKETDKVYSPQQIVGWLATARYFVPLSKQNVNDQLNSLKESSNGISVVRLLQEKSAVIPSLSNGNTRSVTYLDLVFHNIGLETYQQSVLREKTIEHLEKGANYCKEIALDTRDIEVRKSFQDRETLLRNAINKLDLTVKPGIERLG